MDFLFKHLSFLLDTPAIRPQSQCDVEILLFGGQSALTGLSLSIKKYFTESPYITDSPHSTFEIILVGVTVLPTTPYHTVF